jgi:hypothetical protein
LETAIRLGGLMNLGKIIGAGIVALMGLSSTGLAGDYDARNCEFYINNLGTENRHYGGAGFDESVFVTYVSVNEHDLVTLQGGSINKVAVLANGHDVWEATKIEPTYYEIRHRLLYATPTELEHYELKDFLYFIEVKRADGSLDRLWLKDIDRHFAWPDAYSLYPQKTTYNGANYNSYVLDPSPLYRQKHSCAF